MKMVLILIAVEEQLGIKFTTREMDALQSVGDFVDVIRPRHWLTPDNVADPPRLQANLTAVYYRPPMRVAQPANVAAKLEPRPVRYVGSPAVRCKPLNVALQQTAS